jgi:hypothetical protein
LYSELEKVMLVQAVTHLDIGCGRIGIALQVKCPVDGSVSWLWGHELEKSYDLHEPPQTAFLCDPLYDGAESAILPALERLVASGIITEDQREIIQSELGQEALFVFAWWYGRNQPIPHVDSVCSFLQSSETDAPPPMYRPIIKADEV